MKYLADRSSQIYVSQHKIRDCLFHFHNRLGKKQNTRIGKKLIWKLDELLWSDLYSKISFRLKEALRDKINEIRSI